MDLSNSIPTAVQSVVERSALISLPRPLFAASAPVYNDAIGISSCALSCSNDYCPSGDFNCTCGTVKSAIDRCVLHKCDFSEAIASRVQIELTCHTPVRNRSIRFNVMIITMTAFAVPIVASRLIFKQFLSAARHLDTEDWIILVASGPVGLTSVAVIIFGLTANGLGADIWGLTPADTMSFGRYFYAIQTLYVLLITLIKLTLTFFYRRIFREPTIRQLLAATIALHISIGIAFMVSTLLQCNPIRYEWERYDYLSQKISAGSCSNINAIGWANGVISVVSDIWLLAIPLSQLHHLKVLHWKKRLGAALMFCTGAIVTVISFLRLASLQYYTTTSNPTWDQWGIVWWSAIEVEVGLICTCLPTMRLILLRIAPRVFGQELQGPRALPLPATPRRLTGVEGHVEYLTSSPHITQHGSSGERSYTAAQLTGQDASSGNAVIAKDDDQTTPPQPRFHPREAKWPLP